MRTKNVFFIFILSLLAFLIPVASFVYAEDSIEKTTSEEEQDEEDTQEEIENIQEKIDKYEKKISKLQGQANTLQNEIAYMDNQINVTQLKIQNSIANIRKTEDRIEELSEGIENLGVRIDKLEKSISYQESILNSRMRERYKDRGNNMLMMFFGSETLNSLVKKTEYLKALEENDNKLIEQMGETKGNFETQKDIFEDKKDEQETLKAQLEIEKANLDKYRSDLEGQKSAKDKLLKDTQNDEVKYQELLAEAESELASYAGFVQSAGGGVIGSNAFGSGKEGWYYSQRDSRWATKTIGKSSETIYEVGCLVTSVAMLYRHYGYNTTPADIARENNRFWYRTAYMLIPWIPPDGKHYKEILKSSIDSELEDRPVAVKIELGGDGHFVVLSEKSDGDYIMYDPWYGPDLKFSKYYSKGSISRAIVFK